MNALHPLRGRTGGLLLTTALTLTALWSWRRAKSAEKEFPPSGKFLDIDGVRLHYIEQGNGPAVLLLHGNGAEMGDFFGSGVFDELATRYRVIAIDRPGFGYSERPRDRLWTPRAQARLLIRACAALGVPPPIVVAHSFGTLVALAMALENPSPLRGLLLMSGYYFPSLRLDAWLLAAPALPVLGDALRYTLSPLLSRLLLPRLLRRLFAPREVDPRFGEAVPPAMLLRPWQLRAAAADSAFMVPGAARLAPRYAALAIPVEIFAGAGDRLVKPKKQAVRLHEKLRHSTLHVFPEEGHMLQYDLSAEIGTAVDRLASVAPRPAGLARQPAEQAG